MSRNEGDVYCKYCNCMIMRAKVGETVQEAVLFLDSVLRSVLTPVCMQIWLYKVAAGKIGEVSDAREMLDKHWLLNDQFAFENIAVTHPVPGMHERSDAPLNQEGKDLCSRYLCCAECDRGPVGILTADGRFYVACDRVRLQINE